MKVAIACDHAATEAKDALAAHLKKSGYDVKDCGTHGNASVDYPDFAEHFVRNIFSAYSGVHGAMTTFGRSGELALGW